MTTINNQETEDIHRTNLSDETMDEIYSSIETQCALELKVIEEHRENLEHYAPPMLVRQFDEAWAVQSVTSTEFGISEVMSRVLRLVTEKYPEDIELHSKLRNLEINA